MSNDRARWRELNEAATPGPWEFDVRDGISQHWSRPEPWLPVVEMIGTDSWSGCNHRLSYTEGDAAFITTARVAWPAAEREVEQLRALVAEDAEYDELRTSFRNQQREVEQLRALLRQVRADCDADERSSVNLAVIRERIDQFNLGDGGAQT